MSSALRVPLRGWRMASGRCIYKKTFFLKPSCMPPYGGRLIPGGLGGGARGGIKRYYFVGVHVTMFSCVAEQICLACMQNHLWARIWIYIYICIYSRSGVVAWAISWFLHRQHVIQVKSCSLNVASYVKNCGASNASISLKMYSFQIHVENHWNIALLD